MNSFTEFMISRYTSQSITALKPCLRVEFRPVKNTLDPIAQKSGIVYRRFQIVFLLPRKFLVLFQLKAYLSGWVFLSSLQIIEQNWKVIIAPCQDQEELEISCHLINRSQSTVQGFWRLFLGVL